MMEHLRTEIRGKEIYRWKPAPIPEGVTNAGSTPVEYIVMELPTRNAADYGGCLIYGTFDGGKRLECNVPARALVTHLIADHEKQQAAMKEMRDALEKIAKFRAGWTDFDTDFKRTTKRMERIARAALASATVTKGSKTK